MSADDYKFGMWRNAGARRGETHAPGIYRMLPQRIGGRLSLLITLTLLPMVLLVGWIYSERYQTRSANALQAELEVAQGVAATFSAYMQDVRRQMQTVGQAVLKLDQAGDARVKEVLELGLGHSATMRNLSWVGLDGRVVASTEPRLVGVDLSSREYFRRVLQGEPWTVGDLTERGIVNEMPTFAVGCAVRDPHGELRGVIVAGIEPARLSQLTLTQRRPPGAAYAIFDTEGKMVFRSPDPGIGWARRATWRQTDVILDRAIRTGADQVGFTRLFEKKWISARVLVPEVGWYAGAGRDADMALAVIRASLRRDLLLMAGVLAVAFLVARMISGTISAPLAQLERDARGMSEGRFPPVGKALPPTEVRRVRQTVEGLARDLLQRGRALSESEQRLHTLFDHAGVGIIEVAGNDRIVSANRYACQILRRECDEILRLSVHELTWPEDRSVSQRRNEELEAGKIETLEYEKRYIRGDGSFVWVHVTASAILDAGGAWTRSVVIFQDITIRKRAEEALRESMVRFQTLADHISQLAWMADETGSIFWYNQRWYEYTGTDPEQMRGWGWQAVHHPDYAERVMAKYRACMARGERWEDTFPLRGKEGGYRWFLSRAVPIRDESGKVTRWFGTNTDVTDLRNAQESLAAARLSAERAKEAAEEASRAKDHFLAVLSHELRTPLTAVLPALEMLERLVGSEGLAYLEMAMRNVQLEVRLIDDLLDVTRIARGKIELERKRVELGSVVRRAAEVCGGDIDGKQLEFNLVLDGESMEVEADEPRLQQVFWNLIKNAVKFTPRGGKVTVRCWREGGRAMVAVSDTGVGIPREAQSRIFNAFEQAGRSITRQFGGLGLGLAISKALVEMHGGTICVESPGMGQGATFVVELPLAERTSGESVRGGGMRRPAAVAAPALRILLVEDHADTANVVSQLLKLDGHEVTCAADMSSATRMAEAQQFDLLISDLGLPDGTGHDLLRRLREQGHRLTAIALSGYGMAEDVHKSREAGFAEHLTKPVNYDALREVLRRLGTQRAAG